MSIITPPFRLLTAVGLLLAALVVPVSSSPVSGDHTNDPERVTLMGSLMSELGCGDDWDEGCDATDLELGADGTWSFVGTVPAGSYEYRVRLDGSWDESYGLDGGDADIPLVLLADAELRFSYDHESHRVAVQPAAVPEPVGPGDDVLAGSSLRDDLTRERFYFVMADRFANGDTSNDTGGFAVPPGTPDDDARFVHGFDPTHTGFFHGGDLQGVIDQLDYIEGLGTTAIWLTPSFKNKPVQGVGDTRDAGYHGYWITDYTVIDPHLGTNDDMRALVDLAHQRGIKVFFDIITNHSADVITYDESEYDAGGNLPYISTDDRPYVDVNGVPFDDRDYAGDDDFPDVDLNSFPYTPIVPADEADVKVPSWLNDPTYYHNRGVSTFSGESDTYGDFPAGPFSSLDDLWTEHPDVVAGMIDIYNAWVGNVGIDGFRIDTVKHVNIEFWQQFSDGVLDYADSIGNDDFFMFGEVFDGNPAFVSRYTTDGRLQAAVDFGFQSSATNFARGAATTELRDFFYSDDWFTDADSNVYSLPTFLGNHDMGRVGSFLAGDGHDDAELLARDQLAHALMFLSRGQPVVYYGDEQGFAAPSNVPGGIGDQRAREDMFPTQVDLYASYDPIGTDATPADSNFDPTHPLYATISSLAGLVDAHPALADGAQIHRWASDEAGIYAFSRIDSDTGREYVVAINNDTEGHRATFDTFTKFADMKRLWASSGGSERIRADRESRVTVDVPALSTVVYLATRPINNDTATPQPYFATVRPGGAVGGRAEIGASVPGHAFNEVTFAWRPVGAADWTVLGTDDNAPFRVFHDVTDLPTDAMIEYRVVAVDATGDLGAAQTWAVVGDPSGPGGGGGGPVTQPDRVTTPGSFQDEVGCPGEWDPSCSDVDLTLDAEDLVWKKTFEGDQLIPAGQYAWKVAIDGTWDENYGAGAVRDGPDIPLDTDGGPVTFYYSHFTNWATNSLDTPHVYVAPGDFQSELGCSGDWQPDCMRSWLQDPDGDNVWTFRTEQLPPGSYQSKVAQDFDWAAGNWGDGGVSEGPNLQWTVADGEGVEFRFTPPDPSAPGETAPLIEVVTFPAAGGGGGGDAVGDPDVSALSAHWLTKDTIAWDLPASRAGWTYRLHTSAGGGLSVDAEGILGGDSIPLTASADELSPELADLYPHLASFATVALDRRGVDAIDELLTGQVVVAAYDRLGALVAANGVQLGGVLDDYYGAKAVNRDLGVTWVGQAPRISLWAPTATDVDLVVWLRDGTTKTVDMHRSSNGIWYKKGTPDWAAAEYMFDVTVYVPSIDEVVTNRVTDPYSLALTANSERSVVVDLSDPALKPDGWDDLVAPTLAQPEDTTVYEMHVRDFSIGDETVPEAWRGTYKAFTADSDGTAHLQRLADAGLNHLHLLPTYDLGSVAEVDPATPDCDLESYGPASTEQQACVAEIRADDGFNWGYDPYHYTTPEGSYSTDPNGPQRTLEYREMVQAVNAMGLRLVTDMVYNHTFEGYQQDKSVLDRIVPGYYHRLNVETGEIEMSTCCFNTASERTMMEKLMVDSIVTWATDYKVTGFRFDLMGHHSLANMQAVRDVLDELTVAENGVDGSTIYLYGEGWNFGEVGNDARFVQATQFNLAGTGIGSFNDRMRDAVHGGSPFNADPRGQGFATGLFTEPNGFGVDGDAAAQEGRLLYLQDRIKVGLAGNLRNFSFVDRNGNTVTGIDFDSTGYALDPAETVNYVDAHDNETLADILTMKLAPDVSLADRGRMNTIAQATTALSQGVSFWHAGTDLLRSKSLDRDSYDSGDWFNRIDWSAQENTFGSGLPGAWRNEDKWPYMEPLLERADELRPTPDVMAASHERALDLLSLRASSPLFRIGDADEIQQRLSFPDSGPDQARGVITMHLSDLVGDDLDPNLEEIVVVFNATPDEITQTIDSATGPFTLHPIQANGTDPIVKNATANGTTITVPARTVAVFVS